MTPKVVAHRAPGRIVLVIEPVPDDEAMPVEAWWEGEKVPVEQSRSWVAAIVLLFQHKGVSDGDDAT